jgi:tetratricopeptide (TPR) repeat protein
MTFFNAWRGHWGDCVATVDDMLALAWRAHQAGDLRKAEQVYQRILQTHPGQADAHHLLGILACQTGRQQQAMMSIRQAIALNPSAADYHSNLGLVHDNLGQSQEAVACYQQALRLQPDLAVAHSNLANALRRLGSWDEAARHYREAIRLKPDYAEAHGNLAVLLADRGEDDDAMVHYRQAVSLNPNYAEAHYNLGSAFLKQEKLEEAVTHLQHALRVRPNFPEAHNNLGTARQTQGRLDEAIRHWEQALRGRPNFAEAHNNLASALNKQGRVDDAVNHWRQALRVRPDYAEVHYNLGNVLFKGEKVQEAETHYRQALELNPQYAAARCNLGNALESQGRMDEAFSHWQQAVAVQPDLPEPHNNLGNALLRQTRLEEAERHCQQAVNLKPDFAEAWTTLGNVRQHQCRFDEALACYDKALSQIPDHGETHLNRALLWLLLGDWAKGWPEFEWRWHTKGFPRYTFRQPRWDGSPLAGRTLLVLAEQGLGDTLQFIRYVPLLQKLCGRVIVLCQAPLLQLLTVSPAFDNVIPEGSAVTAFDIYIPLLSLPGILGTTPASVPADVPYLQAALNLVEHWRGELEPLGGLKVGIAWQGCPTYGYDRLRSAPLAQFARLAEVADVHLVSLQKGPGTEQLGSVAGKFPILDLGTRLDETSGAFSDTAAVMKNLDLVISSDTAVAHLAGALGVPVWIALPLLPDWRWLLEREDSPWYPTMRLFRQTQYGNWDDVFERMAQELKAYQPKA